MPSCQQLGITLKSVLKLQNVNKKVLAPKLILVNEKKNQKYLHWFYIGTFSQLSTMSIFYLQYLSLSMLIFKQKIYLILYPFLGKLTTDIAILLSVNLMFITRVKIHNLCVTV